MSHRIGECSSCGAAYKLPGSFKADQARCKKCGGVVRIGPPLGGDAPPVPARKVATAAAAPSQAPAAKKERSGPSMKDRLLAQRQAVAAPPAAPPASARPGAPARPAARAGAPAAVSAAVSAAASAAASAGVVAGGPAPRSSPARARRGEAAAGDEGDGHGHAAHRHRHAHAPKKDAPVLQFAIAIVLLAIAVGTIWFIMSQEPEPAPIPVAGAGPTGPEAPLDEAAPVAEPEPEPEPEPAQAPEPAQPKEPKVKDPDEIDLSLIPDFGPLAGQTQEEFDALRQDAVSMIDPMAGAAGNRARLRLVEAEKKAFPAILNVFKRIDFSTQQGYQDGDLCQKTLREICNGNNFEWRYTTEPNDVWFNKRVVERWAQSWDRAKDDEAFWLKLSKQDKKDEPPAPGDAGGLGDLGDLDDIDD